MIIGALFVSFVSWPWVFYFSSIVSAVITLSIFVLVPNVSRQSRNDEATSQSKRFKRLDLIGVGLFTGMKTSPYLMAKIDHRRAPLTNSGLDLVHLRRHYRFRRRMAPRKSDRPFDHFRPFNGNVLYMGSVSPGMVCCIVGPYRLPIRNILLTLPKDHPKFGDMTMSSF